MTTMLRRVRILDKSKTFVSEDLFSYEALLEYAELNGPIVLTIRSNEPVEIRPLKTETCGSRDPNSGRVCIVPENHEPSWHSAGNGYMWK